MNVLSLLWCLFLFGGSAATEDISRDTLDIPDVVLTNQDGEEVHFRRDLIAGRRVVMNFIFTSCPSICPPMGAHFASLQKQLKATGTDVSLISISIDPVTDTPARLKAWRERFGGTSGWNLVTGRKADIDRLLKMLRVFSADINAHAPFVVLGSDAAGWTYVNGLTPPDRLGAMLAELPVDPAPPNGKAAADQSGLGAGYFGSLALVDRDGRTLDLYNDLMRGKIVVLNTFFTSCKSVCPATMGTLAKIRERLGERVGKDVSMVSLTVDPRTDTPEVLRAYAARTGIGAHHHLLTGSQAQVEAALRKLGQFTEEPDGHSNVFIIGNDRTGLWKKALGLAPEGEVYKVVESVLDDKG